MNAAAHQPTPVADSLVLTEHTPVTSMPVGDSANHDYLASDATVETGRSKQHKPSVVKGQMNDYLAQILSIAGATLAMLVVMEAVRLVMSAG